ncbi:MAG: sugar phosphate nucleotidyltransferase, partial [Oscillospiraceae bacterium]|nr:sugar phosphate nucleotidyltransferase [Oscillospiraceae bacterium]
MRTVILAGGEGTRLRPLTCDTPKPLASLCGKPILEYLFDGLLRSGIDRAILTLGYLPGKIQEKYADGYNNLALEFVREDEPLGTAGGMRNAIPDCRDSVFVLSGDALCDYDFARIIANHRRSNASVTIVGTQVNDPREYGLLRTDERNFVTGFVEKPAWSQAVGGIANTGIYILEPDALEEIPVGEKFDFAKDLFPKLIKAGKQINCCRAFGYWCDVGDISTFMQAARDILDRRLDIPCPENEENGIFGSIPKGRYTIKPPVYFGKNVNIADGATVGPYTILEDDTQVGAGARVRLSVLMNAVRVGANCRVTGSLLCDSAVVKRGAFLFEGSVLGSGAVGGEESAIQPGVRIWPGKEVGSGCCASENLQYGSRRRDLFGDDGLDGGAVLSPRFCAALGTAMASVPECRRAAVAHDGNPRSMALAAALVGGLQYGGASVWKLGECFLAQANYCGAFGGRNFTLFVRENKITAAGEGGLPLPRYTERAIEAAWENSAETAAPVKMAADMSNLRGAYTQEIRNQAGRENQRER